MSVEHLLVLENLLISSCSSDQIRDYKQLKRDFRSVNILVYKNMKDLLQAECNYLANKSMFEINPIWYS